METQPVGKITGCIVRHTRNSKSLIEMKFTTYVDLVKHYGPQPLTSTQRAFKSDHIPIRLRPKQS